MAIVELSGLVKDVGYVALGGLVGVESMGVPVPGETALIVAALLAHSGDLRIELVILVAAAGAIIGDNIGYLLGRHGGRKLLEWSGGPFASQRRRLLERGDVFFKRHGAKAVFWGRWVSGLRITAAWLAGVNHMRWPVFLFWNALGGIAWATSIGLATYFLGHVVEQAVKAASYGLLAGLALLGLGFVIWRLRRRRAEARS